MIQNKQKIFYFTKIKGVLINRDAFELEFINKQETHQFEKNFCFKIDNLHDFFFGKIFINVKDASKTIASTKIEIKNLKMSKIYKFLLTDVNSSNSADYYNKTVPELGHLIFKVRIEVIDTPLIERGREDINLKFRFLNTIFNRYMPGFVAKLFNLAFELQNGTLKCKMFAIIGFTLTQLIWKWIFFSCKGHMNRTKCNDYDCFDKYSEITVKKAKDAFRALHHSAIAYANIKMPIFAPSRIRMSNHQDKVIRHILDHSTINENDIIRVFPGSHDLMGIVYFFDKDDLIISLRGTTSPTELLKGLDAEYVIFQDGFAHSGFLKMAKTFMEKEWPIVLNNLNNRNVKRIVLTGHSMGGAVASLLYLILTREAAYKDIFAKYEIKAYSFSAPPSVSKNIAAKRHKNIISYSFEHDTISKLSFGSILDFKYVCISINYKFMLYNTIMLRKDAVVEEIEKIRSYLRRSNLHEKLYSPGKVYNIRLENINGVSIYKFKILNIQLILGKISILSFAIFYIELERPLNTYLSIDRYNQSFYLLFN